MPRSSGRPVNELAGMGGAAGATPPRYEKQLADVTHGDSIHVLQRKWKDQAGLQRPVESFDIGASMLVSKEAKERKEFSQGAKAGMTAHSAKDQPDHFISSTMEIREDATERNAFGATYGSAHEGKDTADNFDGTTMLISDGAEERRTFETVYGSAHEGLDTVSHFDGGSMCLSDQPSLLWSEVALLLRAARAPGRTRQPTRISETKMEKGIRQIEKSRKYKFDIRNSNYV